MDGTLLDLRFDNFFWVDHLPQRYQDIHGGSEQDVLNHVESSLKTAEGTLAWYCIEHWSEQFNVDIMALKEELTHMIQYRDGSKHFLEHVNDLEHLHIALVTDAHPHVLDLKQNHTNVLDHVHVAVSSHQYGIPKRNPDFWQRLFEDLNFDPDHTLMIDDNPHVLEQAREFGIRYLLLIEQPDSGSRREINHDFMIIDNLSFLVEGARQ